MTSVDLTRQQRALVDWYVRHRKPNIEDLRLSFLGALGALSTVLRDSPPPASALLLGSLGRVGVIYVLLASFAEPENFISWSPAPEDASTPSAPSAMLARVLDCAREEFPRLCFYRVVRCLSLASGVKVDSVVATFADAVDNMIRRPEIPPGL